MGWFRRRRARRCDSEPIVQGLHSVTAAASEGTHIPPIQFERLAPYRRTDEDRMRDDALREVVARAAQAQRDLIEAMCWKVMLDGGAVVVIQSPFEVLHEPRAPFGIHYCPSRQAYANWRRMVLGED